MDLHEIHQAQISRYFQLLKAKRNQHVQECEDIIAEIHETRCQEDVYNSGDMMGLVDACSATVVTHVNEEYERVVGGTAVLIASLLAGAESCGLEVDCDISAVQDEAQLQRIQKNDGSRKLLSKKSTLPQLAPVYSNNPDVVREMQALKEENQQWADKLARVQAQVEEVIQERERLALELDSAVMNLESLKTTQLQGYVHPEQDAYLQEVEGRLSMEQATLIQKSAEVEEMRTKKESMFVQESAQFKELKKVIAKKNMQIKELRQKLARYEPDDDDTLIAED